MTDGSEVMCVLVLPIQPLPCFCALSMLCGIGTYKGHGLGLGLWVLAQHTSEEADLS